MADPNNIDPKTLNLFERAASSPLYFAESLLVDPFQDQPFQATYPQKIIFSSKKKTSYFAVHRRAGKCVAESAEIIDPGTLRPILIRDAEKVKQTLVFNFTENKLEWAPCGWVFSGEKECTYYGLGTGVSLTLTANHEVFERSKGWVQARALKLGDQILAPSEIPVFGELFADNLDLDELYYQTFERQKVPDQVFQLRKECLIGYFSRVIQEGTTFHRRDKKIVINLRHPNLLKDFHHLLLRLGIAARVEAVSHRILIEEAVDYNNFSYLMGLSEVSLDVRSPRRWERIIDIIPMGKRKVYDLVVEHEDHNFLANDTVVHNSYSLSILAIWHAITKPNQKIVIFAPAANQVNIVFDNIDAWIYKNPILDSMKASEGNHKSPQRRTFINGSVIDGFALGVAGGIEAGKRGITADTVLVDEAQELSDSDWKVVGPIMRGDRFRMDKMKNYVTGTINKPQGQFYEKINRIVDVSESTEAIIKIPITQNKSYTKEEVAILKKEINPREWQTEWMLEADESDNSVFRNSDLEICSFDDWEYGIDHISTSEVRFIGVDWDKAQAGTNIAVLQYNIEHRTLKMIYREEVPRSEFTYVNAVNKIVEIYEAFRPELVIADQGSGEVQWEYLMMEGMKRRNGLAERLIKKAFNSKLETLDLVTQEVEKKLIKPFLVGLLQQKVQQHLLKIPKHDKILLDQFLQYEVIARTASTVKFSSSNEHIIDCCLFAMYGVWYLYENFLENTELTAPKNVTNQDFKSPWDEQFLMQQLEDERSSTPNLNVYRSGFTERNIYRDNTDFNFYRDNMDF